MAHRSLPILAAAALALLALAAGAAASTVSLRCGGKGARNESSDGTVLCAAAPGQSRSVEGVLRSDSNEPVAGKLSVTFSEWVPQGNGSYAIKPFKTVTVGADGAGKFAIPVKTTSEVSLSVEAVADEKLGISASSADANVQLQLKTTVKKLGGGRVEVKVKGTTAPLKIAITDETGYEVGGGSARKAKHGVATFNLGAARGTFGIYVDAGELSDLFWLETPSFKL